MARDLNELLDGMTARELKALSKKLAKQAAKKEEKGTLIKPGDERLAPLHAEVMRVNQELKIKTVDTLNLLVRRMRLSLKVVPTKSGTTGRAPRSESAKPLATKKTAGTAKSAPTKRATKRASK